MYWLKSVLGPRALSLTGNLEGEGLPLHGRGRMPVRLTRSHGLQRTLAKPPQLHPLGAATGKGEGEMPWYPEPHTLPLGRGWHVLPLGGMGKELCPHPAPQPPPDSTLGRFPLQVLPSLFNTRMSQVPPGLNIVKVFVLRHRYKSCRDGVRR